MGKKNKSQRFVDALTAGLVELGAKEYKTLESRKSFHLDTVVGNIDIHISADVEHCYTMFARFDNVEEAKAKFNCNPYSGKYNTHVGNEPDMTPEKAAEICLIVIQETLPIEMTFNELKVGESYKRVVHMFGDAKHDVTCISNDVMGLKRGIKYFCRKDSIKPLPSEEEVKEAMQEVDTPRMRQIRMNIFSVWDFELDGETPSSSFFCL